MALPDPIGSARPHTCILLNRVAANLSDMRYDVNCCFERGIAGDLRREDLMLTIKAIVEFSVEANINILNWAVRQNENLAGMYRDSLDELQELLLAVNKEEDDWTSGVYDKKFLEKIRGVIT